MCASARHMMPAQRIAKWHCRGLTHPCVGALLCNLQDGCTPLHYAVYSNREANVIELLRAGAKADIADAGGKTALDVATAAKLPLIIEYIKSGPPAEAAEGA